MTHSYWAANICLPQIIFTENNFFTKFFWILHFWTWNLFNKIFSNQILLDQKISVDTSINWLNYVFTNLFYQKIVGSNTYFLTQNLWSSSFFYPMFFYQSFVWNEFLSEPQLYQTQPKLSAISQLLLIQFCPNFKVRLQVNFPGPSLTRHNCSGDICPCNICPRNKCLVFLSHFFLIDFWTQNILFQSFFRPIFCVPKLFYTKNSVALKIVMDSISLWIQNFLEKNHENLFWRNNILTPDALDQNFWTNFFFRISNF